MLCKLEEKPLKRKIFKLRLEKSQEICSSTIIRGRLHLHLSLGVQINPKLTYLFFIEFIEEFKLKVQRIPCQTLIHPLSTMGTVQD